MQDKPEPPNGSDARRSSSNTISAGLYRATEADTAAVRDHVVDVLRLDGTMAALIEMRPERDHLLVVNVAVSPDYQGQGYGRVLFRHAGKFARSLGLRELRLYTSVHLAENVMLYKRVGYQVDREEQASPHLGVFVYMSKRI